MFFLEEREWIGMIHKIKVNPEILAENGIQNQKNRAFTGTVFTYQEIYVTNFYTLAGEPPIIVKI
jgi:hypothetical protein